MPSLPEIRTEYTPFIGGYDTETPPLNLAPGMLRSAQNYEHDVNGGYVGCKGYERFSGKAKPSDAIYYILNVSSSAVVVADTVTGVTSAATGVVVAIVDTSLDGQGAGYLVITKVSGTFNASETLTVGGVNKATTSSTALAGSAATALLDAQYTNLAADSYRADIAAVPGEGNILGLKPLLGTLYAFRNAVGGATAAMYKSSSTDWVLVALGEEISFTNANTSVGDADVLTQGAVTATIGRVVLQTGTLQSGVNTGRLIISGRAGGNFGAGAATSTGGGALTLSAIQTAITLQPSGRYSFEIANFGGAVGTVRMYGCDGKNRGFEFDGTTFVPIATGMATDTPTHLAIHKFHLFYSFGGSVQHSGTGKPYQWTAIVGANEIGMGDTISGFAPQPGGEGGGALAILTRNTSATLYGDSVFNWNLVAYKQEAGAYAYSIQRVGETLMMDDRGIVTFATAIEYGNFADATLSKRVKEWLDARRSKVIASCIARDKNQYRIFFTDKSALYVTMDGRKVLGMMPQLFGHAVTCATSDETTDGTEEIFFGGSNGMVYQMEKGTSHDGAAIEAFIYLAYNNSRSPRLLKRYRRASFEISGVGYAEPIVSYSLGYGSTLIQQGPTQTLTQSFSIKSWDSGNWDVGEWDGVPLKPSAVYLAGTAENISLVIQSNSDYHSPLKFSGVILHYTPQRNIR